MQLAARTGAWIGKPLPYLRRVAYLESHGTEWISTWRALTRVKNRIYCEFYDLNTIRNDYAVFATSLNKIRCVYPTSFNTNISQIRIYGTEGSWLLINDYDIGKWHNYDSTTIEPPERKWILKFDGAERYNGSFPSGQTVHSVADIGLFGYGFGHGTANPAGRWRIRKWMLWEDDTLTMSLIPVIDTFGRPAMYDEVSGELFYNQGQGEFTWGELDAASDAPSQLGGGGGITVYA